jgi:hypothetical protein
LVWPDCPKTGFRLMILLRAGFNFEFQ